MDYKIEIFTEEHQHKLYHTTANSIDIHTKLLSDIKTFLLTLQQLQSIANFKSYNDLKLILEFNAYLNISILDSATVTRQLILTSKEWEKSFYIKHTYSLIFETIKTYNENGGNIRMLINRRSTELNEEYLEISKDIRQFKKDYNINYIETVRNTTAAHIGELSNYFNVIDSLDIHVAVNATRAFLNLITRLINLSTKFVNIYNELGLNPLKNSDPI